MNVPAKSQSRVAEGTFQGEKEVSLLISDFLKGQIWSL